MNLHDEPRRRKSLRNIRALIVAFDPTFILAAAMVSALMLAGMEIARLIGNPAALITLLVMLVVPPAVTGYGWYLTVRGAHPRHPAARTPGGAATTPRNWHRRYDPVPHTPPRVHTIIDTRRPRTNGRIHSCVQLGRGQQNRTVGDRLNQDSG